MGTFFFISLGKFCGLPYEIKNAPRAVHRCVRKLFDCYVINCSCLPAIFGFESVQCCVLQIYNCKKRTKETLNNKINKYKIIINKDK